MHFIKYNTENATFCIQNYSFVSINSEKVFLSMITPMKMELVILENGKLLTLKVSSYFI